MISNGTSFTPTPTRSTASTPISSKNRKGWTKPWRPGNGSAGFRIAFPIRMTSVAGSGKKGPTSWRPCASAERIVKIHSDGKKILSGLASSRDLGRHHRLLHPARQLPMGSHASRGKILQSVFRLLAECGNGETQGRQTQHRRTQ